MAHSFAVSMAWVQTTLVGVRPTRRALSSDSGAVESVSIWSGNLQ